MSIQTSTGVKIYISTQLPATFDLAGYGVLTWTEIKEVTNIVPPSPSYQVVTHEPLKSGIKQKNKGFVDYGDPTIDYALDTSDTGQQMLQSAASGATKNLEHSFKLTYPNGDIRYFSGRVFSSLEGGFSANSMVSGTSNVGVSRAIVKIPAISFAANYVTNTYSILGEAKTFADAHTFTRSTTATFVGSNGLIQSAAIDAPRFTYDPVTLAPKGLLIEGSRANLLTYSEQFDNAAWVKDGATITANATTAPDGSLTADRLIEDTSNGGHKGQRGFIPTINTTYTFSAFVKAAERTKVNFSFGGTAMTGVGGSGADLSATFDLSNGSIISNQYQIKAEKYNNGWYKISITGTTDGDGGSMIPYIAIVNNAGSAIYTGDGTSGIYIWGAQLEAGSFVSSYIPTTTAQVTRTADVCTAKEFTSWYNQGEGSVFVDINPNKNQSSDGLVFDIGDGTGNNRTLIRAEDTLDRYELVNVSSGSLLFFALGDFGSGSSKLSASMKSINGWSASQDGDFYSGNIGVVGSYSSMRIGHSYANLNHIFGTIAQLNYYPTALSDEALQDLTR